MSSGDRGFIQPQNLSIQTCCREQDKGFQSNDITKASSLVVSLWVSLVYFLSTSLQSTAVRAYAEALYNSE